MFVQWIAKIFVAINSNTRPAQISLGFAFAFLLAMIASPALNLFWLCLFIITFFLKINQAIEFVFLTIFGLCAPLIHPLTSRVGALILNIPALHGFFTALNNIPVVYFFRFNHTLVIGGLAVGIVLFVPLYLVSGFLLKLYREKLREKIANSRIVKGFLKMPLVDKLKGIFGNAIGFYHNIKG